MSKSVQAQLRRALVSEEERKERRLKLRRMNGQRPTVDGHQQCPVHQRCTIVFYSNNSHRHVTWAELAAARKAGAR